MCVSSRNAHSADCPLFKFGWTKPVVTKIQTPGVRICNRSDESLIASVIARSFVHARLLQPMGEETEPMIDQEMFHQMMESMDKDGDGTVTKVIPQCVGPHSTHGHAPAALHVRTPESPLGWPAHGELHPGCGACARLNGAWLRRARLPHASGCMDLGPNTLACAPPRVLAPLPMRRFYWEPAAWRGCALLASRRTAQGCALGLYLVLTTHRTSSASHGVRSSQG